MKSTVVAKVKARPADYCSELGTCQGVCDGQSCRNTSEREKAGNYHPHLQQQDTAHPWAGLSEWAGKLAYNASIVTLIVVAFGGAAGYAWGVWIA